jgi:hypothetical protein
MAAQSAAARVGYHGMLDRSRREGGTQHRPR